MCVLHRYLETTKISCFSSNFHLLNLACINVSCLQQLLLWYLPNCDLYISLISSAFINWNYSVRKMSRLLPLTYLFDYLIVYIGLDSFIFMDWQFSTAIIYFVAQMVLALTLRTPSGWLPVPSIVPHSISICPYFLGTQISTLVPWVLIFLLLQSWNQSLL